MIWDKNNTEIIGVIIKEVLCALLHRKGDLTVSLSLHQKNETVLNPLNDDSIQRLTNSHPVTFS